MKFGKQLSLKATSQPEWKDSYIDYKLLKQFIKESHRSEGQNDSSHAESHAGGDDGTRSTVVPAVDPFVRSSLKAKFRALLVAELEKVDLQFIKVEKRAEASLDDLNGLWRPGLSQEEWGRWRAGMIKVIGDLENLLGEPRDLCV